jgi:hypothetical protein
VFKPSCQLFDFFIFRAEQQIDLTQRRKGAKKKCFSAPPKEKLLPPFVSLGFFASLRQTVRCERSLSLPR